MEMKLVTVSKQWEELMLEELTSNIEQAHGPKLVCQDGSEGKLSLSMKCSSGVR